MKKMIIFICAIVVFLSCGVLATTYAHAAVNACAHDYRDTYVDPTIYTRTYQHAYLADHGYNSATYLTCRVDHYYRKQYKKCKDCSEVDYSNYTEQFVKNVHSECGLGTTFY